MGRKKKQTDRPVQVDKSAVRHEGRKADIASQVDNRHIDREKQACRQTDR